MYKTKKREVTNETKKKKWELWELCIHNKAHKRQQNPGEKKSKT